jgi:UDP-3-O-[3-hydroxymyristoyl] N-acetylglucosamine deacetylase
MYRERKELEMDQMQPVQDDYVYQHTLRESMTFVGQGLHSGQQAVMQVIPAEPDSGIVFYRRDVEPQRSAVHALWDKVVDTRFSITLGNDQGVRIHTVKPVLAALYACGIDNARVMLDGPEVPVMDGSAMPYVSRINSVGALRQANARRVILIRNTVPVSDGHGYVELAPATAPWISLESGCEPGVPGAQKLSLPIERAAFEEVVAAARVLVLDEPVSALRAAGFAKGATNHNVLVMKRGMILNEDSLRYPDEHVRHMAAECIGDLSLAGARIIGRLHGCRTSHQMNHALLCALMRQTDCWKYVTLAQTTGHRRASGEFAS